MRGIRVWARLVGLQRTVVEDVTAASEGEVIVAVRPSWRERNRCGVCRRRCVRYELARASSLADAGSRDVVFLEADAPRVSCRRHSVVVAGAPWARHASRFTRSSEDQVAWLAVNTSKTAVAELMRVAWRSVSQILERVADEGCQRVDLLDGLRRIGIETSAHSARDANTSCGSLARIRSVRWGQRLGIWFERRYPGGEGDPLGGGAPRMGGRRRRGHRTRGSSVRATRDGRW